MSLHAYASDRTIDGTPRVPLRTEREIAAVRPFLRSGVDEIRRTNWDVWLVTRDPKGLAVLLDQVQRYDQRPARRVAQELRRHGQTL